MQPAIYLLIIGFSLFTFNVTAQASTKKPKASAGKKTHTARTAKKKTARIQYGTASFYANKFNGRKSANGEIFSQKKLTAAHNSVPLGTWIKVTNLRNKKSVIVKVTDRLHHRSRRLVDLSRAAASKLSFSKAGLLPVKIEILGKTLPVAKAG